MNLKLVGLASLAAAVALSGPALARGDFDDLFFVRSGATAAGFFQDRAACSSQAEHMGDSAAAYSNPEYGALSAMGSALEEDALHEGGLHRRMQQAVFTDCMKQLGWTPADLTPSEAHELMKATPRRPELLEAWLKAHPPAAMAAADTPVTPTPAQTVKTAAAASLPASPVPPSTTVKSAH